MYKNMCLICFNIKVITFTLNIKMLYYTLYACRILISNRRIARIVSQNKSTEIGVENILTKHNQERPYKFVINPWPPCNFSERTHSVLNRHVKVEFSLCWLWTLLLRRDITSCSPVDSKYSVWNYIFVLILIYKVPGVIIECRTEPVQYD
jgi:hypothetical protein